MDYSKLLTIFGLIFNTIAAVILIFPYLNIKKNLDDDYITSMDKDGKYTQKKHLKEWRINMWGLAFLAIGFILQFASVAYVVKENTSEKIEVVADDTEYKVHSENFDKYFCEFTSNVGWTVCTIEALDRASAEREWKQRKLEVIKSPQVNEENMLPQLNDEQEKMRRWRVNFETGRDSWCESRLSFRAGSGTPGGVADCKLDFELQAIKDLNFLHYDIIIYYDGQGISDFEPTDSDVSKLVETNKTSSGCGWTGEDTCD